MNWKKKWLLLFITFVSLNLTAQDFICQLSVNSSKISGSNRERYNKLQQDLYTFINDRKWSQYTLKANERIECAIMITLDAISGDVITATMTLQLQRPIYGSSYKSTILNFQDKDIKFTYVDGDPLEYVENASVNQLTSLIAFYLNLFLAVDFDSFSLNGGSPYYSKCQAIVSLNQNATEPGWKVFETGQKNRYWLMENLTNGAYAKIHTFLYNYHRLGLDVMAESPDIGRASILESLQLLQDVNKQKSNLYIVQLMVLAKSQEIINIFKEGTPNEKSVVVGIMRQLDPANQSKYAEINN